MATYPSFCQVNSQTRKPQKPLLRSEYESLYVKQRPRTTRNILKFEFSHWLNDSDYATLEDFFNTNNGLEMDYVDPKDSQTYTVIFDEMDELQGTYNAIKQFWEVKIKLREV